MRANLLNFEVCIVIDYGNNVVHQVSRAFSFCLTETLHPLISNSQFLTLSWSLEATIPLFDCMNLTILDISY